MTTLIATTLPGGALHFQNEFFFNLRSQNINYGTTLHTKSTKYFLSMYGMMASATTIFFKPNKYYNSKSPSSGYMGDKYE
jgi:hypothetical protein